MAILKNTTIQGTGYVTVPAKNALNRPNIDLVVQSFTSVGTTSWTAPAGVTAIDVLVVAGGGGGGAVRSASSFAAGAGGGAGGIIYQTNYAVTPNTSYTVTVGAGGAGSTAGVNRGANGGNSVFGALTAIGGGGGASWGDGGNTGGSGGSGGGGSGRIVSNTAVGGAGTAGQGFDGGIGSATAPNYSGGGGGGAGGRGGNGDPYMGGGGGIGLNFSISKTPTWYGGGGGGGVYTSSGPAGRGGLGGGGNGGQSYPSNGENGIANTGGGGGGASSNGSNVTNTGGAGGSGIVIIRYSLIQGTSDMPSGIMQYNSELKDLEFYEDNTTGWVPANTSNNFASHNLMAFSEAISALNGYVRLNATDSILTNQISAPNGTLTASLLSTDGASSSRHTIQINPGNHKSYRNYTFSVFVKARGDQRYVGLETSSYSNWTTTGGTTFDLLTGTVVSQFGSVALGTITSYGDGWYRISATAISGVSTFASGGWYINLVNSTGANAIVVPSTDGLYIWGVQDEEDALVPGLYTPTLTSSAPAPISTNTDRIHLFNSVGKATIVSVKAFHVVGVSRAANYTVQYSDNGTSWTTAFGGVMSGTAVGMITGTVTTGGSGTTGTGTWGPRRFWRYVEGTTVTGHHPRVSRIVIVDTLGIEYDLVVYAGDNDIDRGMYIIGTTGAYRIPSVSSFVPAVTGTVEVLVVAGGGAGGNCEGNGGTPAGGGGGGGVIYNPTYPVTAGNIYTVRVGTGGPEAVKIGVAGTNGGNSAFGALTAIGGGGGGGDDVSSSFGTSEVPRRIGLPGGSGGGASNVSNGGAATLGQGNRGGGVGSNSAICSGGGGAGGGGGNGNLSGSQTGGPGLSINITGEPIYYGGGGGGGGLTGVEPGLGGKGGGGRGASFTGTAGANALPGTDGLGGGGGGSAANQGSASPGARGGDGIVIVKYSYR